MLLVEQKSGGRDLIMAREQALDYFPNLKEPELPRYILVSDFLTFELHDLDTKKIVKFPLKELDKNIEHFGFIAGYQKREYKDQEPVNIKASELMGKLFDAMKESGYRGTDLELFLTRILFCLFADDTGIFNRDSFRCLIEERTAIDGSDTGMWLTNLFQTLNTEIENKTENIRRIIG
jgi:hypothetical protein